MGAYFRVCNVQQLYIFLKYVLSRAKREVKIYERLPFMVRGILYTLSSLEGSLQFQSNLAVLQQFSGGLF